MKLVVGSRAAVHGTFPSTDWTKAVGEMKEEKENKPIMIYP